MSHEMDFPEAVRVIEHHVEGARGDVSERKLNAALVRVLPTLQDVRDINTSYDRSAGQRRRYLGE